jgi:RHS repeat-associated protein
MFLRWMIYLVSVVAFFIGSPCHAVSLTTGDVEIPAVKNSISTVVCGCVDIESGMYFDADTDMTLSAPSPWHIGKSYTSETPSVSALGAGRDLSIPYRAYSPNEAAFFVMQEFGPMKYYGNLKGKTDTHYYNWVPPTSHGLTNAYAPILGAMTNTRGSVTISNRKGHIDVKEVLGDGSYNYFSKGDHYPIKKKVKYHLLRYQHRSNGTRMWVDHNAKDEPARAWCGSADKKRRYNDLTLHYADNKVTMKGSDGQEVKYTFTTIKKHPFLANATYPEKPSETYTYGIYTRTQPYQRLTKIQRPNNRFRMIDYHNNRKKMRNIEAYYPKTHGQGGVSTIKEPVGTTPQPITIATLYYGKSHTEVHDPYGKHYTRYQFDKKRKRLEYIEDYARNPDTKQLSLHTRQEYYWGKGPENSVVEGNLFSKVTRDGSKRIRTCTTYTYDESGNVLTEVLWGNISGHCSKEIVIDKRGTPQRNGVEVYTTKYTYSDDGRNVMTSKTEDNGSRIEYRYDVKGSSLLTAKIILWHNEIKERMLYSYDGDGCLVAVTKDAGGTRDIGKVNGVARRVIRRIKPSKAMESFGKPHVVEEYCYSKKNRSEELLKKTVYHYDKRGLLAKKEFFDKNKKLRYHVSWQYDGRRRPAKEQDSRGTTRVFGYDANNNLTFVQGPNFALKTYHTYDFANRRVSTREVHTGGREQSVTYRYDYNGNKVSETDIFGHTTSYSYDSFGRETKIVSPPIVIDDLGRFPQTVRPTITKEFDIFGNETLIRDARGNVTTMAYGIRGKPSLIRYPDKSVELFYYNLDGTLRKKVEKDKSYVMYSYDYKGNVIKQEWYWPVGHLLKREQASYNAFGMQSFTDAAGVRTSYHQDLAGRCSGRDKEYEKERYYYDAMGNKGVVVKYYGDGKNDYFMEIKEYDLYGNVVVEKKCGADDVVTHRAEKTYDPYGNCIEERTYTEKGVGKKRTSFDTHNNPIKIVEDDGATTAIRYDYTARNSIGQRTLKKTVVDPHGNSVVTIFNTHGKPFMISKYDIAGKVLDRHEYRYDAAGNKRYDVHFVHGRTKEPIGIGAEWRYDSLNRMVGAIEAKGTAQQRVTSYGYNSRGCVTKKILPNGVVISSSYDILNRRTNHSSSDKTFNYRYVYNYFDEIASVHKVGTACETRRWHDRCGRLVREVQENSLAPSYTYDRAGRCTQVRYCNMIVRYEYKGPLLHKVQRIGSNGEVRYEHVYEKFNLSGTPTEEEMVGEAGTLTTSWDAQGRCREYVAEKLRWSVPEEGGYDKLGNITMCEVEDRYGSYGTTFSYNALQQLVEEKGHVQHSYTYDSRNNRFKKDDTEYHVDLLDQVVSEKGGSYHYSSTGNVVKKVIKGKTYTYGYDANNNLLSVNMPDKSRVTYSYDPFGRRIVKIGAKWDEAKKEYKRVLFERFLYFGDNEIAVYDHRNDNPVVMRMLGLGYGQETGATLAVERGESVYAVVHDNRGSVAALLHADGQSNGGSVAEGYRYSAYGEAVIFDGMHKTFAISQVGNPWRYCGKHADDETGYVWFGRRYYSAALGRWVTRDPAGSVDGPNLYAYVCNAPMTYTDMLGLYSQAPNYGHNIPRDLANIAQNIKQDAWAQSKASSGVIFDEEFEDNMEAARKANASSPFASQKPYEKSSMGSVLGKSRIGHIGYTNGINNPLKDCLSTTKYLSKLGGDVTIDYVHNATHGTIIDSMEYALGRCNLATTPVTLIHMTWQGWVRSTKPGELFLHICHSHGTLLTKLALESAPKEVRDRIIVLAIAPSKYIPDSLCHKAFNYVSKRDVIPMLDGKGKTMCANNTFMLNPHENAPILDHSITSPTYAGMIDMGINYYKKMLQSNGV